METILSVGFERRLTMCLMGYWQDLRRGNRCPDISDFDPDDLRTFRDDCVSFEPAGAKDQWRCQDIGVNLATASNNVESPLPVPEIPPNTLLSMFVDLLPVVQASKFACLKDSTFVDWQGNPIAYRAIVLPFLGEGADVSLMVGLARQRKVGPST